MVAYEQSLKLFGRWCMDEMGCSSHEGKLLIITIAVSQLLTFFRFLRYNIKTDPTLQRRGAPMFKHLSIGTKSFDKGDVILRQGDPVEYLYLLESGTCYRHMVTDKGDTIIYAIKKPGNTVSSLLGVLNLYNRDETSCFSFVARSPCQCQCIPVEAFRKWADNQPAVLKDLIILSSDNSLELRLAFRSFQEGRIANRLCRILMNCSEKTNDGLIISKDYTFSEMASMLGVHHVTVSRIVRSLCNDGVLQKQHQYLKIMDAEKLARYAKNEERLPYK